MSIAWRCFLELARSGLALAGGESARMAYPPCQGILSAGNQGGGGASASARQSAGRRRCFRVMGLR